MYLENYLCVLFQRSKVGVTWSWCLAWPYSSCQNSGSTVRPRRKGKIFEECFDPLQYHLSMLSLDACPDGSHQNFSGRGP